MMISNLRAITLGLLLASAAPVLAQAAPPAPGANATLVRPPRSDMRGGGMFAGMSEAGRATMREAMKAGGDPRAEHQAVKAARDRMLVILDADTLDTAALRRAMDDERKAAEATREKRQAAMLAGFTKLSVADRKAFVANARDMKERMETRMAKGRGGREGHGGYEGRGGPGGHMPPPPMM
jgi:Spy/CpxP family protein refolding chaperone